MALTITGQRRFEHIDRKIKFLTPLQLACALALFNFTGTFMRLPIIPLFAKSAGASTEEVGIIVSLFFIVAAALAIPSGFMSDKFGRKKLLLIGSGISAVTSFMLVFSTTPLQIGVLYTIAAFGPPAFTPTIASLVGDITAKGQMGKAYGWYTLAAAIGMVAGPAIGGMIAAVTSLALSFLFSSAVILIAFILALTGLPESKASAKKAPDIRQSLSELSRDNRMVAFWLVTFFLTYAYGTFVPFFPLYASSIGLGVAAIGWIFAIQSVFNAISRVPAGHHLDSTHNKEYLILTGVIVVSLSIVAYVSTTSLIAFLILSAIYGLAYGIAATALGASIGEAVGHEKRGAAMGGYTAFFYLGQSLSAVIQGKIIASYGYWIGFLSAAVISLLGAAVFYILIYGKPASRKDGL